METGSEFATSREHVRSLVLIVGRLKQLVDAGVERTQAYARDMMEFGNQLKALGSEQLNHPRISSWQEMKKGFGAVARYILTYILALRLPPLARSYSTM